jgi:hypothetical protein
MKVTIEFDEKELIKAFADAAIDMDKETLKRLIRGLITESVLSLNAPTMRQIADKFVTLEHEINYRAKKENE